MHYTSESFLPFGDWGELVSPLFSCFWADIRQPPQWRGFRSIYCHSSLSCGWWTIMMINHQIASSCGFCAWTGNLVINKWSDLASNKHFWGSYGETVFMFHHGPFLTNRKKSCGSNSLPLKHPVYGDFRQLFSLQYVVRVTENNNIKKPTKKKNKSNLQWRQQFVEWCGPCMCLLICFSITAIIQRPVIPR